MDLENKLQEEFMNETMEKQESKQEVWELEPLFLDELERKMAKEQEMTLKEKLEPPAEMVNAAEKTKLIVEEPAVMDNVLEQDAYQVTSTVAEQREELLVTGTPMPPQERQAYIQQHAHWRELTETKGIKDFDAEKQGNQEVLRQLSDEIKADQLEASESYQKVKDTFLSFMEQTNIEKQFGDGMLSTEQFGEYVTNYQRAVEAVNGYLESHKGHRWSSKGKQRKRLVTQIAETLAEREKYIRSMQVAVETLEELHKQQQANQGEIAEQDSLFDTIQDSMLSVEQIQEIIVNGSCEERFRALYQLSCQLNVYEVEMSEEHRNTLLTENSYINELLEQLCDSIQKAPIHEQAEYMKLLFALDVKAEKTIQTTAGQYFNEAPIGIDGEAYAVLKCYHSPMTYKYQGLQKVKNRLAGPFMEMYKKQLANAYQERHEGASLLVENIPANTEKRNEYMAKIPREQWDLVKRRDDAVDGDLVWLKKTNFVRPRYMNSLFDLYQDLLRDEEGGSDSFLMVKRTMKIFMEGQHFDVEDEAAYKKAYKNCIDALEAYAASHKGYRFSEKGRRRQTLINNILEGMYTKEFLCNNTVLSPT